MVNILIFIHLPYKIHCVFVSTLTGAPTPHICQIVVYGLIIFAQHLIHGLCSWD